MKAEANAKSAQRRPMQGAARARHAAKSPVGTHVSRHTNSIRTGANAAKARRSAAKRSGLLQNLRNTFRRAASRPRRVRNRANTRAALWLWCFPVGLSLTWRSSCTWKKGVKIGISAAMAAVLAAIFLVPIPSINAPSNGVQVVADKPTVEVYGPALPNLIVPGYTRENTGSIIVDQVESDAHYVYAADDARCYHEYECKFAFASSQRLTVYEAYYLGFEPCGRCKPPVYTPGITDPVTADVIGTEDTATDTAAS